jgi:hypothetical protein
LSTEYSRPTYEHQYIKRSTRCFDCYAVGRKMSMVASTAYN